MGGLESWDPLGFIGPVTTAGKIVVRKLHANKMGWDTRLPDIMLKTWESWRKDLCALQNLRIPRWIEPRRIVAVHGFADASELAYGAVVYADYGAEMAILASKSRVAPLKSPTIPRLELCAALLLAKLMTTVIKGCELSDKSIFVWSDSTITLHWLQTDRDLKVFVHNRVQKIKELTATWIWQHTIKSELNPADLISRGVSRRS